MLPQATFAEFLPLTRHPMGTPQSVLFLWESLEAHEDKPFQLCWVKKTGQTSSGAGV